MKIALSAESTVDLTEKLIEEWNINLVKFRISIGEEEFFDGDKTNGEIYSLVYLHKVLPKTSAVNQEQYREHFTKLFNEGYDAIIHISLSSEISTACNNARAVAKEMKNVYVIDSRSLSTGIALLCHYARVLIDKGIAPDKIQELVSSRCDDVEASFILYTLEYLYKGGRCSLLALFGANLLKIRPQILVINGKMAPSKKFIGEYNKCVEKYAESIVEKYNKPDKSLAFVTYSSYEPEMIKVCKDVLIKAGFERIEETSSGSTITSHCGENCIGVLFINGPEPEI